VHFGAIRGLDGFKNYDSVIVAGREQPPPVVVENMARALFGADQERLLLTGEYVPQMRGHRMRDGTRTAVVVQVHPDPRVQALVEQIREREIEQMVGRLRLVHRAVPARVFLLSNLPTALPVHRLASWHEVIPTKLEQAIAAGRGVVPLSAAELARAHPSLWATEREFKDWQRRKGVQVPIRDNYWNLHPLSEATLVSYRRAGQSRGSPHTAIVPAGMAPAAALEALLGPVEHVTVLETWHRPAAIIEDYAEPEPIAVPIAVHAPYHVIDVDEAFVIGPHDCQRWTLATGQRVLVQVEMARRWQLALRPPERPATFWGATA
jgi:hypothetical protein